MPQFQTYPIILAMEPGDLLLVYQNSTGSVKTIDVNNLGEIGIAQLTVTEGANIAKGTGKGRIIVADEGADVYNAIYSRNAANSAYLPLTIRTNGGALVTDGPIRLDNIAIAATPAATHTLTVQDANGQTFRLLCAV